MKLRYYSIFKLKPRFLQIYGPTLTTAHLLWV